MTQRERRNFLIKRLIAEQPQYSNLVTPQSEAEQEKLLRSLFNVRMPKSIDEDFLKIQDEYLREETAQKGITDVADLIPAADGIYLWRGDITTLKCGAAVSENRKGNKNGKSYYLLFAQGRELCERQS